MAIEFKHGGKVWRADTPDEAITLRNKLEEDDRYAETDGEEPEWRDENIWTPDVVSDLLEACGEHQKAFLRALYPGDWVSSDKILKALSLASEVSFAGVLSGLSKQLKKLNVKPWQLYTMQIQWKTDGKVRSFRLSGRFRWAAEQLGWPDQWR
jgi:hypothetical protein